MKIKPFLYLLTFIVMPTMAIAQQDTILTYTKVLEVPGVGKDDLFFRARQWTVESFKDPKSVLQVQDKESGELSGKAYTLVKWTLHYMGSDWPQETYVSFLFNIYLKDGKYKYVFTNFEFDKVSQNVSYWTNRYITTSSEPPTKVPMVSAKKNKAVWLSITDKLKSDMQAFVSSLEESMNKKAKSDF